MEVITDRGKTQRRSDNVLLSGRGKVKNVTDRRGKRNMIALTFHLMQAISRKREINANEKL